MRRFYRMAKCLYIFIVLLCFHVRGQVDSIQIIRQVNVSTFMALLKEKSYNLVIDREDIETLQPTDIGDLLRKTPGANLKSYGGLGGLKTISMRGLGANHSSMVVDGVPLNNSQTGQVNLGQLIVDNVEQLTSSIGLNSNFLIPVSAQISGSNFMIKTMENSFSSDTLTIRANFGYGSFGQTKGYIGVKFNPNKFFVSAFGSRQQAEGNYNYSIVNGCFPLNETRKNNNYLDHNYGVSGGVKLKKGTWKIGYHRKSIRQELPGAVIYYNETADEKLETDSDRLFTDFKWRANKLYARVFFNGTIEKQRYFDPTYLNVAGQIDNTYTNRNLNGGVSFMRYFRQWSMFGGVEETVSDLVVNDSLFAKPIRLHTYAMLGVRYNHPLFCLTGQASSQYVYEQDKNGGDSKERVRFNPFLSLKTRELGEGLQLELWYRNSFRVPSFNELYYTNIGNVNLLPEDAHQINMGFLWLLQGDKFNFDLKSNIFVNHVKNKIVAVPTKNLFIWSMQNVGRTNTFGGELKLEAKYKTRNHWAFVLNTNYTYQKTVDVTDPSSPTYLHQIAYIPEHTVNTDLTLMFRRTGVRISNYVVSKRYALNENILANELEGFFLMDASIFHTFRVGSSQSLKLIGNVKNALNSSYAYIRSYIMPGINYSISLSYAFN